MYRDSIYLCDNFNAIDFYDRWEVNQKFPQQIWQLGTPCSYLGEIHSIKSWILNNHFCVIFVKVNTKHIVQRPVSNLKRQFAQLPFNVFSILMLWSKRSTCIKHLSGKRIFSKVVKMLKTFCNFLNDVLRIQLTELPPWFDH